MSNIKVKPGAASKLLAASFLPNVPLTEDYTKLTGMRRVKFDLQLLSLVSALAKAEPEIVWISFMIRAVSQGTKYDALKLLWDTDRETFVADVPATVRKVLINLQAFFESNDVIDVPNDFKVRLAHKLMEYDAAALSPGFPALIEQAFKVFFDVGEQRGDKYGETA